MTIQCQFCALPLELAITPDMDPVYVRRFAPMTVHNACADRMEANQRRAGEDVRLAHSMQSWELLAPAFYHGTEAWLAAGAHPPALNLPAIQAVLAWEYGWRGVIAFGQRSGTGKTSAAYLLLKRLMLTGKVCAALTHTEFSQRATRLIDEKTGQRWIRLLATVDMLLIDDFGKSRFKTADGTSKQAEELLFDVLDRRITEKLPTILTSNDNARTIRQRMSAEKGEAFLRRLREFFHPVNFDRKEQTT